MTSLEGSGPGPLTSGSAGRRRARLSVIDRESPRFTARSGTLRARRETAGRCSAGAYTEPMSAQREELLRLVEELPEEEVPAVLDDVRRHLRAVRDRPWPPAWFGAGEGRSDDTAARSEDLLEEGFGWEPLMPR